MSDAATTPRGPSPSAQTLALATSTSVATVAATISRSSVPFGALSSLWGETTTPAPKAQPILSDDTVPAIFTHPRLADAHGGPTDLAASTGSVPSTATTLTNNLPPTQSAALRALNAPAFHSSPTKSKSAKSTSSRTTVTSQPVVVRTYSGSRHASRPGSGFTTPRSVALRSQYNMSALSAELADKNGQLPSADDFSFSAILRAVDPEIRDAIDAIAEICARSRLSMADEYDAHLPPQGEITSGGPGWAASAGALAGRGRLGRVGQNWNAAENTLMAVPEASSSSERLAQECKNTSFKKRSQSAYGSLKSVISGSSNGKRKALDNDTFRDLDTATSSRVGTHDKQEPAWAVKTSASSCSRPAITIITLPTTSKQLTLDTTSAPCTAEDVRHHAGFATRDFVHYRASSALRLPMVRMRSGTLSALSSWLSRSRSRTVPFDAGSRHDLARAETRLREMLTLNQSIGRS